MTKSNLSDWSAARAQKWRVTLEGTEAMLKPVDELPGLDEPGPSRYGDVDTLLKLLDRAVFVDLAVRNCKGRFSIGGELPPAEAANFATGGRSSQ